MNLTQISEQIKTHEETLQKYCRKATSFDAKRAYNKSAEMMRTIKEHLDDVSRQIRTIADSGILPDGDHVTTPVSMWLKGL